MEKKNLKNNANKIILKRNEREREERKNEKREREKKLFITRIAQKGNYVHEKVNTETDFLPYLVVIDKEQ